MVTKQRRRYSTDTLVRGSHQNIEDTYLSALPSSHKDGENWYPTARVIATKVGNGDVKVGSAILAILSPTKEWSVNIQLAYQLVSKGWAVGQTADNNRKALRVLRGEIDPDELLQGGKGKGGAKVSAFYRAILYPTQDMLPVIDRHAIAVYYGKIPTKAEVRRVFDSPRVIRRIQKAYIKVAMKYKKVVDEVDFTEDKEEEVEEEEPKAKGLMSRRN